MPCAFSVSAFPFPLPLYLTIYHLSFYSVLLAQACHAHLLSCSPCLWQCVTGTPAISSVCSVSGGGGREVSVVGLLHFLLPCEGRKTCCLSGASCSPLTCMGGGSSPAPVPFALVCLLTCVIYVPLNGHCEGNVQSAWEENNGMGER